MAKVCMQYNDSMDCDKATCVGCPLFGTHVSPPCEDDGNPCDTCTDTECPMRETSR